MARAPAKPWARAKAARRVLSPDEKWAAAIRERVLGDCHPFQLGAVEDPSRFITLLVGRGGGKTTSMRARAILKLTSIRRARLTYIAPTRPMAEELMWEPLKHSLEHYGLIDDCHISESKLACTCKRTGAVYKLVGLDDKGEVNKLRGRPFDEVQPDEASLYPAHILADLLDRAVGPRLGERNGCIVMGGTPGHILSGPFYDFTRTGASVQDDEGNTIPLHRPYADRDKPEYSAWDSYSSHHWTLKDVAELPEAARKYVALVNLWAEALKVKKRNRWSDDNPIWLREYLGQWAADDTDMVFRYRPHLEDGKLWNQWDPYGDHKLEGIQALKAAIAKLAEFGLKDLRYVISDDMGSADPFASNVFAFSPSDLLRQLWHVMGFERTGMYARTIAELTIGVDERGQAMHDKPAGIIGVTGWPDGMVMDTDQATLDELSKVYGLRFVKADRNPNYKAGAIELTNGDFVDGRIKIIKGSHLERQLQSLQWAEDQFGRVKENKAQANHSTDTLIYGRKLVAEMFETGSITTDAPPAAAAGADAEAQASVDGDYQHRERNEFDDLLVDAEYVDAWGNG